MSPWNTLLAFWLVSRGLASSVTTMSAQGRPVTDTRNDVAVEYVSTGTLPYMMILLQPLGRLRGNSRVSLAAQTAILAKAENDAADALNAAGLELTQAEVAAAAAKERRGDKSDDTMSGDDLEAVVKFVHKKDSIKGWSSYNTKAKRVAFLASLVPVWTERVACDAPAVPPVAAAAAAPATAPFPAAPLPPPQAPAPLVPQATVVDFVAMTAAERRAHMAALTAAMAAHDE